jgi:hypothetical protein
VPGVEGMSDVLVQICKRGTSLKISPGSVDPAQLARRLMELRAAGHAIVAEETFDSQHISLGVTVTHYLSCVRCP